jgi:hypothetical protein
MPAINKEWYPQTKRYNDICAQADPKERCDCTIKAIAMVTGTTYDKARTALEANGKKPRCGCKEPVQRKALKELGFKARRVNPQTFIDQYPEVHKRQLKNVTTHQPDRFPHVFRDGKTYLVYVPKHVLAMIDGAVHDWTRGRRKKVTTILEILPI